MSGSNNDDVILRIPVEMALAVSNALESGAGEALLMYGRKHDITQYLSDLSKETAYGIGGEMPSAGLDASLLRAVMQFARANPAVIKVFRVKTLSHVSNDVSIVVNDGEVRNLGYPSYGEDADKVVDWVAEVLHRHSHLDTTILVERSFQIAMSGMENVYGDKARRALDKEFLSRVARAIGEIDAQRCVLHLDRVTWDFQENGHQVASFVATIPYARQTAIAAACAETLTPTDEPSPEGMRP